MSSPLLLAPLLAAFLAAPVHGREVRAEGLVVRATATEAKGLTSAEIEVRGRGIAQHFSVARPDVAIDMLLQSIRIVDANFDGHPDVIVLHDVFLFDVVTRRFSGSSPLAQTLSRLPNVAFDAAHKTITTHDAGPSNPSRVTYTIAGGGLQMVDACRFVNPGAERVGTLIRTHGAHTTYTELRLAPSDIEPCGF